MNVLDHLGAGQYKNAVIPFFALEIVCTRGAELDVRSHGSVEDDGTLLHGFEVFPHVPCMRIWMSLAPMGSLQRLASGSVRDSMPML